MSGRSYWKGLINGGSGEGPITWNISKEAPTAQSDPWEEAQQRKQCEHWVDVLWASPNVQYLVTELQFLGRTLGRENIKCIGREGAAAGVLSGTGGYLWQEVASVGLKHGEIAISQRDLQNFTSVSTAIRHELIHAYDDARAEVDPSNCFHHACSEIRASRLSGECAMGEELLRGNSFTGDGSALPAGQQCVKRRATISVGHNPVCRTIAQASVDAVWDSCLADSAPYHKFPLDTMFAL